LIIKLLESIQAVRFSCHVNQAEKNISVKNLFSKVAFSFRMPALAVVAA